MNAIEARSLTKRFGDLTAVDSLDLSVRRGELYGLVGPDEAGKTTTMRLLTGIMEPTAGETRVAGLNVSSQSEALRGHVGYMPQRFGLYEDLTVLENIHFYADLYSVPKRERPERIGRLLGFSNLTPFGARLAGRLSGGMKQKLGLACALIHTPQVLFLDEPTNGVDPLSRRDFWRILHELLGEGMTIFVSTSYLDEAERCGRVGLLHRGRLLVEDDPANIRSSLTLPMIELWCDDPRRGEETAGTLPQVRSVGLYGDRLHLLLEQAEDEEAVLAALQGAGVREHRRIVPSLEDVFIHLIKK